MAAKKETPRQRMISMMYLVLTALLALNVSKEVLDAFIVVNESVERSNYSFSQKINSTYGQFELLFQNNQAEVLPFWSKAQKAQEMSKDFVAYIEDVKAELIAFTEDISEDSARNTTIQILTKLDDNIKPTNFFMGASHTGVDGKAGELRERIRAFYLSMLDLVDEDKRQQFVGVLDTEIDFFDPEGKIQSWETHHFYDTILAADITLLNKLITEVYTLEFDVVNFLLNAISADDFKYDKIAAKVLPRSAFLFTGESYTAEVIVAAYDTTQTPEVYVLQGVDSLPISDLHRATQIENSPGKTLLDFTQNRIGENRYAGVVRVDKGTGKYSNYHFNGSYTVARPSYAISAEKMNVLYAGVENPISISVSGVPANQIIPTLSTGTIEYRQDQGNWMAKVPSSIQEVVISVQARINGQIKYMGDTRFRVKRIPTPKAVIANHDRGYVDKRILISAGRLEYQFPKDFEFQYPYEIKSFELNMQRGFKNISLQSGSSALTPEMIQEIRRTNRGQKIFFEKIEAIAGDGIRERLPAFMITIE